MALPSISAEKKTGLKWLFCSTPGILRLKKFFAGSCGIAIMVTSIFVMIGSFLDPSKWIGLIRCCWNLLFGFQMVLMQFKFDKWLFRHFGFLAGWFGRAFFFLFVGTNIMDSDYWWSYVVGACCIFVGCVELMIGCKCAEDPDAKSPEFTDPQGAQEPGADQGQGQRGSKRFGKSRAQTGPTGSRSSATQEPTFTVNVAGASVNASASQLAGAAQLAGSLASTANASGGGDNPFFGNSHLANENRG